MTQKRKVQLFIACSFIMASFQACGPIGQPFGVANSSQSAGSTGSGSGTSGTPQPGVSMPPTSGSASNSSNSPGTTTSQPSSGSSSGGNTSTPSQGSTVPSSQSYMADPTVTGHTLEVCASGCSYTTIAAANAALTDGDTVNVHVNPNGDYVECFEIVHNNIILNGVLDSNGNRPHIRDAVCQQKGIIIQTSVNVLIQNFEISGARNGNSSDGSNYAGIRFNTVTDNSVRNLKVRNCIIHDNDDGILGNDNPVVNGVDNQVVVESSTFYNNGRQGYAHGLYIGAGVTNFVFKNSVSYNNLQDGHLLKTRALTNTIECSTLASLNGVNSYALDIPVTGTSLVTNSVIEQGPNISNGGDYFIRYGEELAQGHADNNGGHSLTVQNTYFINDNGKTPNIDILSGTATPNWSGNTFAGSGGPMNINNYSGANSFTSVARASSYDGTLSSLPPTPVCQ